MTKEEVQSRVLHNGKPLSLEDFTWNEEARVFSSSINTLVLNFKHIDDVTFDTSSRCKFKTGSNCTFDTSSRCKFKTGSSCIFDTGSDCKFDTGSSCIFNTSSDCKFKTGNSCIFDTGSDCKFKTGSSCTFKIGERCVIMRRDIYEIISNKKEIQICPYIVKGHLEKIDDIWYLNGDISLGEHIIADGILSKVVSKKKIDDGIVYRVYNYTHKGMLDMVSYLIETDGVYTHGDSIRDARDSLMYKMVDRDTSVYIDMTLDTVYTIPEAIKMYRTITGACSKGVKMFIESIDNISDTISVKDILNITKDQYGYKELKEFIDKTK